MKTFSQFIKESRTRMITLGPSRSRIGRQRQQAAASERAAFRRAGVRRNRPGTTSERRSNRVSFTAIPKEYTSTAITSYPNQSSYARESMPAKVDDRSGRVNRTIQRALYLRRLSRQTGGRTSRGVHVVDVLPKKDFKKNDPAELMTRGKEYHSSVRDIPKNVKSMGKGEVGDVIVGKASEVMPGSKDPSVGRKKREQLYTRVLGATRRDPITNVQVAKVR